ncbi:hypothetical protein TCON_2189 [Astathelohania contejeani]|uniref:Uncharacterized protein n=1 Tax=Astathelohania contejeani TaxID=164912 RepID=A0ABQ7HWP0_9MICR|nr:hypothetical protein TCON_2189 [Thelohania contejeani]
MKFIVKKVINRQKKKEEENTMVNNMKNMVKDKLQNITNVMKNKIKNISNEESKDTLKKKKHKKINFIRILWVGILFTIFFSFFVMYYIIGLKGLGYRVCIYWD